MKKFLAILIFGGLMATSYAAPPLDLTDQTGDLAKRPAVTKVLTEDEITFTESTLRSAEDVRKDWYRVEYDVIARRQPLRSGTEIRKLKKGDNVRLLGQSKDTRWFAVDLLSGNKVRAWLPRSAIKLRPKKGEALPPKKPLDVEEE